MTTPYREPAPPPVVQPDETIELFDKSAKAAKRAMWWARLSLIVATLNAIFQIVRLVLKYRYGVG